MKIGNLEINKDKFGANALVGGKFVLNNVVHAAAISTLISYTFHHPNLFLILVTPPAVVALCANNHRINFKLAKEAKRKELPITKMLVPQKKK